MNRTYVTIALLSLTCTIYGQPSADGLSYAFDGHYGQVEVGGRYAGVEFHRSRPLPSRISFYSPVANSIDLSTDYWKRDVSLPMAIGVRIGDSPRRWIGREPWSYTVSPHAVMFIRSEEGIQYTLKYEFCINEPAMVISFTLRNNSSRTLSTELYTHILMALRTCQTYARKDSAWTSYNDSLKMIAADFDDPETGRASVFVENAGETPVSWTSSGEELAASDSGTSNWVTAPATLQRKVHASSKGVPIAAFEYRKTLAPGDSLAVVEILGSCRRNEVHAVASRLRSTWNQEMAAYDEFIRQNAERRSHFVTGIASIDRSVVWAKALLAANAHYLDAHIVPMPCPAEYNFFFTHDVLMTDLAAVNFDIGRVKKDLQYIVSHANNNIIPHAYYWRDDGYKTEYCTPDNWNHFWFILVTGSYLRHSLDDSLGKALYPLVTKSLEEVLTQVKPDHLMYAFRPDWWDIGHIEGPRSYMTILTIRALREYAFVSSYLHRPSTKLPGYEALADSMQSSLNEKLWDDSKGYLMNYNGDTKDDHYYMGSLLAAAFDLLPPARATRLLETARYKLQAENIGIRTAMPADFHKEEVIDFFKFHGDEAGQPYLYINGGVWPHCNAWYARGLHAVGRRDEAVEFVKSTMTIDGIVRGPMGQPAMYEYHYTDIEAPDYGKIDKPSFLWAGGFYLGTLYSLFGVNENEWNISFSPSLPSSFGSCAYTLIVKKENNVVINKGRDEMVSLVDGGGSIPSLVYPLDAANRSGDTIRFEPARHPYLQSVNAIVRSVRYESNVLRCILSSFRGHQTTAVIIARTSPKSITVDGVTTGAKAIEPRGKGTKAFRVEFRSPGESANLELHF